MDSVVARLEWLSAGYDNNWADQGNLSTVRPLSSLNVGC